MTATPTEVSHASLLATLERGTTAFTALLRERDLRTHIPACPDFDLAGLAWHLGGVHLWATAALASSEPPPRSPGEPPESAALPDWYADTARGLLAALHAADPSLPCFTFGPPQTTAFWARRMAHETTIHLRDAQSAFGQPEPLDAALSADGIAEVLTVFLPRQVALGRTSAVEQPVAFEATDTGGRWLVGDGEPVATVRGPAASLLLLLWKRAPLDDPALQVDGDPTVTLALALTP